MTFTQEELEKAVAETQQESYIMIKFSGFGQAEFTIFKNNVNPAQVLGALSILELQVKNWFVQEENKRVELQRSQQLSVPAPAILRSKGH